MAHQYSSFNSAFAAHTQDWEYCETYYNSIVNETNWGRSQWSGGNDHAAINNILNALVSLGYFLKTMFDYYTSDPDQSDYLETHYWSAGGEVEEYELTWQKIIAALVIDEYACAVPFTYVMDKIRKVAWNKPFLLAHALSPELYQE